MELTSCKWGCKINRRDCSDVRERFHYLVRTLLYIFKHKTYDPFIFASELKIFVILLYKYLIGILILIINGTSLVRTLRAIQGQKLLICQSR